MRAAIYLRISRDDEMNGLAIERQREDCMKVVTLRGWELTETYVDQGISASKRNVRRPAYDQMQADYARGAFEAIVCYDLDRLTRQPRQLEDWIDLAESRGLALVTATGEADLTTDNGRLFARIKASVARAEVERKGARQRRANDQRAARGLPYAARRIYGYETDAVTERPDEAEVVRGIYAEAIRGTSYRQIARDLNARGIRATHSKVGTWDQQNIRHMIRNRRYSGEIVHRGVWLPGSLPPMVDPEIAAQARALQADPARRVGPGPSRRWLLSGLAKCGVCQAPLAYMSTPAVYACTRRSHDHSVRHVTVRAPAAEAAAIRGLADVLVDDGPALLAATTSTPLAETLAALERNEAAAVATARDRDEGLLSAQAAHRRLTALRDERTALERRVSTARLKQSAVRRLVALAEVPALAGVDPIRDALDAAARIEAAFRTLPFDQQREAMLAAVYITIIPSQRGMRRAIWRRVRVVSRMKVDFAG